MAKTKKIEIWRCTVCKSENVQIRQWVNPNTNEVDNSNGLENEDCFCQDCEEHTELELISKRVKI
jgi:hypothetical protein